MGFTRTHAVIQMFDDERSGLGGRALPQWKSRLQRVCSSATDKAGRASRLPARWRVAADPIITRFFFRIRFPLSNVTLYS
jgi:hypothetical protein